MIFGYCVGYVLYVSSYDTIDIMYYPKITWNSVINCVWAGRVFKSQIQSHIIGTLAIYIFPKMVGVHSLFWVV